MEMFKAEEVWILHNSIKMCISVINEPEKKNRKEIGERVQRNYGGEPTVDGFVRKQMGCGCWYPLSDGSFLSGHLNPISSEELITDGRTSMVSSHQTFQRNSYVRRCFGSNSDWQRVSLDCWQQAARFCAFWGLSTHLSSFVAGLDLSSFPSVGLLQHSVTLLLFSCSVISNSLWPHGL